MSVHVSLEQYHTTAGRGQCTMEGGAFMLWTLLDLYVTTYLWSLQQTQIKCSGIWDVSYLVHYAYEELWEP